MEEKLEAFVAQTEKKFRALNKQAETLEVQSQVLIMMAGLVLGYALYLLFVEVDTDV